MILLIFQFISVWIGAILVMEVLYIFLVRKGYMK
jgi:hypothetical protein